MQRSHLGENAAQSSGGECFGYAAGDSARGTLREYTLTLTDKTGNVIISMGKGIGEYITDRKRGKDTNREQENGRMKKYALELT